MEINKNRDIRSNGFKVVGERQFLVAQNDKKIGMRTIVFLFFTTTLVLPGLTNGFSIVQASIPVVENQDERIILCSDSQDSNLSIPCPPKQCFGPTDELIPCNPTDGCDERVNYFLPCKSPNQCNGIKKINGECGPLTGCINESNAFRGCDPRDDCTISWEEKCPPPSFEDPAFNHKENELSK
jgi:hypothetical protein